MEVKVEWKVSLCILKVKTIDIFSVLIIIKDVKGLSRVLYKYCK